MKKTLMSICAVAALALGAETKPAEAQNFWLGQILPVGFTFCPRTTAEANGQLLPIASNTALFSLYGTTYGGDGRTTFALPDLRGRNPIHVGTGPGLPTYRLGQRGGATTVTQTINQLANHTHTVNSTATATLHASDGAANSTSPSDAAITVQSAGHFAGRGTLDLVMEPSSVTVDVTSTALNTGGQQPMNILDPYLTIRYCVVLQGIFPSRS